MKGNVAVPGKAAPSIWIRNMQLALITLVILSIKYTLQYGPTKSFFHDFSAIVWMQTIIFASGGLLVAILIKHTDSVRKSLVTGLSVITSSALSIVFDDYTMSLSFVFGSILSLGSIQCFNNPKISFSSSRGFCVPAMRHLFLLLVTGSAIICASLFHGTISASIVGTNTNCVHVKSRDVLIGFAVNYNAAQIYPTLHAFHEMTGPQQDIVLFVTLPNQVKVSSAGRLSCVTCTPNTFTYICLLRSL